MLRDEFKHESMLSMLSQWAKALGALGFLAVAGPPLMAAIGVLRVLEPIELHVRSWCANRGRA